eukprot:TRINITY_DN9145_c0_g2_i1.p1 TRINITY_DN9145_c0_g2~~TRINITY_DN9145_c0_g2_i1.p1  ORF type:complete len:419 (+),score=166.22 TRINITY_DN9145_c0_g2_i1:75-1331(+)
MSGDDSASAPTPVETVSSDYSHHFDRTAKVKGIKIDKKLMQEITRKYKDHRYGRKGVRPVVDCEGKDAADFKIWLVNDSPESTAALDEVAGERVEVSVKLTSVHYSAYEILSELLPKGMTVPSSFEGVGHIAHLNLKDEHHPYRLLIGKVILDKNPGIKTVVNKLGTIGSVYREFQFELLAGIDDFNATVKQHGCTFVFPYDKVYWNSRLQTEHTRLVKLMKTSETLCDVMGGVGPFAVPAAKKGVRDVRCNDLNPESYKAMQHNAKINGVERRMQCYCMDGREFIHKMRDELLLEQEGSDVHFSMNLPATAVEFLDAFDGWGPQHATHRVLVHVYCFSSAADGDYVADSIAMARHHLGAAAAHIYQPQSHHVRNVAPKKEMMCVTFRLTAPPAELKKRKRDDADVEGPRKVEHPASV